MSRRPLISVVSPVYGCTGCLEALADAVRAGFAGRPLDWELVLVDDRGPDDPWPRIEELARRDARVRGVRLMRNHGQHLAIWAGLGAARGDWVAVIDCDLQDDPAVIPELHARAVAEGVDAMLVDRGEWSDTGFRRWASRAFNRALRAATGLALDPRVGNFGLYSRRLTDTLLSFRDKEVFLPVMVTLTGLPQGRLTLDRAARHSGTSAYDFARLMKLALAIVVRFSDRPLKLSAAVGLAFSGLSALVSVLLVAAWAAGAFTVPGWTSVVLSVWFLAGLILAVLGVHGVYVGRIFAEVQPRPRLLVERTTDGAVAEEAPRVVRLGDYL